MAIQMGSTYKELQILVNQAEGLVDDCAILVYDADENTPPQETLLPS